MKRMSIFGMSKSRRNVGADIEQGTRELILHLIKLWFFPNSQDKLKWRKEVAEKLNHVDRLKSSNRYPSPEFILKNSWSLHESYLDIYINIIQEDYGYSQNPRSMNEMQTNIHKYFIWISDKLSKDGLTTYKRIYEKLEELGF